MDFMLDASRKVYFGLSALHARIISEIFRSTMGNVRENIVFLKEKIVFLKFSSATHG